jgi:hypothetical protein
MKDRLRVAEEIPEDLLPVEAAVPVEVEAKSSL